MPTGFGAAIARYGKINELSSSETGTGSSTLQPSVAFQGSPRSFERERLTFSIPGSSIPSRLPKSVGG